MEESRIHQVFIDTKKSIAKAIESIKENQEKSILESLSKELVINLCNIKSVIKELESIEPEEVKLQEEIARLENEIAEQDKLFESLKKFEIN